MASLLNGLAVKKLCECVRIIALNLGLYGKLAMKKEESYVEVFHNVKKRNTLLYNESQQREERKWRISGPKYYYQQPEYAQENNLPL